MSFLKYSVGCISPTVNTSLRFNFPEQDFFPPWNKRQRPHCLYTEAIAWPYTSVNWRRASSCLLPGSLYMGNLWCNARSLTTDTEKSKVDVHWRCVRVLPTLICNPTVLQATCVLQKHVHMALEGLFKGPTWDPQVCYFKWVSLW